MRLCHKYAYFYAYFPLLFCIMSASSGKYLNICYSKIFRKKLQKYMQYSTAKRNIFEHAVHVHKNIFQIYELQI